MARAYADLTIDRAVKMLDGDTEANDLLRDLHRRTQSIATEQQRFRTWCDRADKLYYAEDFTKWGADLWADDPFVGTPGRSHVSVNTPAAYVDIPSALQSVEPIENMLATDTTDEARTAAAALERIRYAWKREEQWDLKRAQANTVKSLYGRAAARVYWKPGEGAEKGRPCVEIIDQPRNLYLGWKSTRYDELLWTAYVERMAPQAVMEEFSVEVEAREMKDRKIIPFVRATQTESVENSRPSRPWLAANFEGAKIEVWNYWHLKPSGQKGKRGERTPMVVCNAVFVGNELVRYGEYPEYDGRLPIVPLFNTYIPGVPDGRPDLYDIEHLIREEMEVVTAVSQMIHGAIGGQYWQLTGQEAPWTVPPSAKPKLNEVIGPGPGNRVEAITPFLPTVNAEQHLSRIDRDKAIISGLSDLLLGLAPAQVLSSSKAINALIANYESRLSMRRGLLFQWERDVWKLVINVWAKKDETVGDVMSAGGGTLDITDPSLTPRDDMETATRALNLVAGKVWSLSRAQDATGVDDPEQEQNMIREERTDATLFPADVQTMVQLLAILQQMGQQAPQGVQQQAQASLGAGQNALRLAGAEATPDNSTSSQLGGDQGVLPPEAGTPAEGQGLGSAESFGPPQVVAQSMIQGGETSGRILSQATVPTRRKRR